ncbi:MmcQ/YjbR family DNA-binding protein [Frigoribacterium sp. UYMn621]|uniref:MmcQ/YjbR family DNA-binding protein n=1 Tax=Frigoribacterium sp. UYMn621 TaxID=3156343 RepID=UPI003392AB65
MRASPADIESICLSLPEVELGISWGDRPTYKVPRGAKGRGFLLYRAPGKTAIDPVSGDMFTDLLVIQVADEMTKRTLVQDPQSPFFTIDHFNGYNAVLVQESRLGELERDQLVEIIADAWATKAPPRLVREYFANR